jgi:hypothetical protein
MMGHYFLIFYSTSAENSPGVGYRIGLTVVKILVSAANGKYPFVLLGCRAFVQLTYAPRAPFVAGVCLSASATRLTEKPLA